MAAREVLYSLYLLEAEPPFQGLEAKAAARPLEAHGTLLVDLPLVSDKLLWSLHLPFQIAAADNRNQ